MSTRSKTLLLMGLALTVTGWSQILSIGVKAGTPATNGFQSGSSPYQRRYTVGPTVEVRLPLHLSFEVDALYRREGERAAVTPDTLTSPRQCSSSSAHMRMIGRYRSF